MKASWNKESRRRSGHMTRMLACYWSYGTGNFTGLSQLAEAVGGGSTLVRGCRVG